MDNPAHDAVPFRDYLSIALVSCAVLLYEIAITRILSVVVWYHFAFLSLSLAMLGLGAPGVWFSVRPPGPRSLTRALLVGGIAIPLSIAAIFRMGALSIGQRVPLIVLCILIPMLALGAAICILLIRARGDRIGTMYGADLLGGVLGAMLVLPLMIWIPTPRLIAFAGFLPLGAAVLLAKRSSKLALLAALALAAALVWDVPFQLRYTKSYTERRLPEFERWTPTARITVWDRPIWNRDRSRPFLWGTGSRYQPRPLTQKWIEQDGSAGTPIEGFRGSLDDLEHLRFDVTGVGYELRRPDSVCVIGPGGGRDVLAALQAGARRVDAVELNGGIVEAVSGPFADFSGDVYHLEGVSPVVSEGRSYLMRAAGRRYDLIQISLVDSWAATAAGAYALSENYLYTMEAFRLYFSRLTEGGILSVSRWFRGSHQMESARLANLVVAALRADGVEQPESHVAFVAAGGVVTLLAGREPFSSEDLDRLNRICADRGFDRHWPANRRLPPSTISRVMAQGIEQYRAAGLDLSPPVDDRPFFFQTTSLLRRLEPELAEHVGFNERAVSILRSVVILLAAITAGLFSVPLLLSSRIAPAAGFWRGSLYFASIGIGFMFIEVPWIQRFILYVGHPSLATTAVIAALLLGAGVGSMLAPRVAHLRLRRLGIALPVTLLILNLALRPLFEATLAWPIGARLAVTLLALAPAGTLMGFAFPVGMIRFGDRNKAWFWAVNGALSVLGSGLSVALSMVAGFGAVLWLGVGAYVLALTVVRGR